MKRNFRVRDDSIHNIGTPPHPIVNSLSYHLTIQFARYLVKLLAQHISRYALEVALCFIFFYKERGFGGTVRKGEVTLSPPNHQSHPSVNRSFHQPTHPLIIQPIISRRIRESTSSGKRDTTAVEIRSWRVCKLSRLSLSKRLSLLRLLPPGLYGLWALLSAVATTAVMWTGRHGKDSRLPVCFAERAHMLLCGESPGPARHTDLVLDGSRI